MSTVVDKFLRYVKIDTQSNPNSESYPSTNKQRNLANLLLNELKTFGLDAFVDEFSYVYTKIPANTSTKGHKIGLIAHLDTSPDAPGANVNPRIIENYHGQTINLNEFYQMDPTTSPNLLEVIGDDIIVTDGNTLLGADDKAGIAEIMQVIQEIISDTAFLHDDIYICFTPDEEIGQGTDKFDFEFFKADFAYTVDGGQVGSIEYENFNAASARIEITGKSFHPGSAKNQMVNAIKLAFEFNSMLPSNEIPEQTEGYEGFFHLTNIKGQVEDAVIEYIIRDHDDNKFNNKKKLIEKIAYNINQKYQYDAVKVTIKDQYYNMITHLKDKKHIINIAKEAIIAAGLSPISEPIRGGTDGASLTYKGLPTPNLGTGGYNYHGRYEFASINQMKKSVEILKNILMIK